MGLVETQDCIEKSHLRVSPYDKVLTASGCVLLLASKLPFVRFSNRFVYKDVRVLPVRSGFCPEKGIALWWPRLILINEKCIACPLGINVILEHEWVHCKDEMFPFLVGSRYMTEFSNMRKVAATLTHKDYEKLVQWFGANHDKVVSCCCPLGVIFLFISSSVKSSVSAEEVCR